MVAPAADTGGTKRSADEAFTEGDGGSLAVVFVFGADRGALFVVQQRQVHGGFERAARKLHRRAQVDQRRPLGQDVGVVGALDAAPVHGMGSVMVSPD